MGKVWSQTDQRLDESKLTYSLIDVMIEHHIHNASCKHDYTCSSISTLTTYVA